MVIGIVGERVRVESEVVIEEEGNGLTAEEGVIVDAKA